MQIGARNAIISRLDAKLVKQNVVRERKQGVVDQMNRRGKRRWSAELQRAWLREQSKLVRLVEEKDAQGTEVDCNQKQLSIFSQKKLRIETKINRQKIEASGFEESISTMPHVMFKLNVLLREEVGSQHQFEPCMELMANNGLEGALKQAVQVIVALRAQLVGLAEKIKH